MKNKEKMVFYVDFFKKYIFKGDSGGPALGRAAVEGHRDKAKESFKRPREPLEFFYATGGLHQSHESGSKSMHRQFF